MKRPIKMMLIVLISLNHIILIAQQNVDSLVKNIRKDFIKVQSGLKTCKKKVYTYTEQNTDPEEIKFTAYYLPNGRLVKLQASFSFSDGKRLVEYYLRNSGLFFLFATGTRKDGTQIQERVYYDHQEIIKSLIKEKRVGDTRGFGKIKNKNHPYVEPPKINSSYSNISDSYYGRGYIDKYLSYPAFPKTDDNELKLKRIKAEYNKIETKRKSGNLTAKNVSYVNERAYWNNTNYDVFYNENGELLLLSYCVGEEGYSTCDLIYFKDRKPFFVLSTTSEPGDDKFDADQYKDSQIRTYIYNDHIIRSLLKQKMGTDKRNFSQISNQDRTSLIKDLNEASKTELNQIHGELWRLFQAFEEEGIN